MKIEDIDTDVRENETEPEAVSPQEEEQPLAAPQEENGLPTQPSKKKQNKTVRNDKEFRAKYNEEKEKEFEKLAREIEEKNRLDSKAKNRKWWIKTVLMLVLIVVSVVIMFTMINYISNDDTKSFAAMIKEISLPYLFLFLGVVVLFMIMESMKYAYLLKISTGKFRLRNSIKTMFLGRYYDGITPLGTGGQPFQIYYLHKKNDIPAGIATAIPLVRFIVSTIVFCLVAIVLFIFVGHNNWLDGWGGGWSGDIVLAIAIIAMAFNFFVPIIMVFVSLFPRLGKKMIVKLVGFLSKIKLVKHRYPTMKKYVYEAGEYRKSMKLLFTKWWKLLPLAAICIIETVLYLTLPYMALLAIEGPAITDRHLMLWLQTCCFTMISYYAASLVPTPGNSGASEAMTTLVFLAAANTIPGIGSVLGWVILLWRFANYYLYILSGIGISIFEIIRSAVRRKRAAKTNP